MLLNEDSLSGAKLVGMLLGLVGLALVFVSGRQFGEMAVLFGTLKQATGAVWLKRLHYYFSCLQCALNIFVVMRR